MALNPGKLLPDEATNNSNGKRRLANSPERRRSAPTSSRDYGRSTVRDMLDWGLVRL